MALLYDTLAQLAPSATTATTLYTATDQVIISGLSICNRDAAATTVRVAIRKDGASLANAHYVLYDAPIDGNGQITALRSFAIGAGDVITVYAGSANLSFSLHGASGVS